MTDWLARWIEQAGETFEKANPALFRFFAAVLPYSTPLPVAWLTMRNAATFLGFEPWVAFVFVFGLEGMGLWFTSMLVDAVVDFIRSRNAKTGIMVVLFSIVVTVYVYLLVNLNVTLEKAAGNVSETYSDIVTLLCFLPLLTGIGNGYYKLKLDYREKETEQVQYDRRVAEIEADRRSRERITKAAIKHGRPDPFAVAQAYHAEANSEPLPHDWRNLTQEQRYEIVNRLTVKQIVEKYPISEATAYNWKNKRL